MKKILGIMLLIAFAASFAPAASQDEGKVRMGVLRFTNRTSAGWWSASVSNELSDMLASELVSTGSFEVLERGEIEAVLGEQDLGASGRINPATKAKIGKLQGAKYLVAATVSAYEEGVSGSGGGVSFKGLSVGGKKDRTYIAVDLKIIDTTTGAIADARTIEAESKGSGIGAGLNIRNFSVNGNTYKQTPAGKAIRACIVYISEYLDCSLVQGKDAGCMKKWNDMEKKRREKTKGTIDIE